MVLPTHKQSKQKKHYKSKFTKKTPQSTNISLSKVKLRERSSQLKRIGEEGVAAGGSAPTRWLAIAPPRRRVFHSFLIFFLTISTPLSLPNPNLQLFFPKSQQNPLDLHCKFQKKR